MAITLSSAAETAAENAAANAVADLVDAGSGAAAGAIVLFTAEAAEVARCVGQDPFFGDASEGVCTQIGNAVDSDAAGSESAVTNFELVDKDDTMVLTGSVGESGEDLNIDDENAGGGVVIEEDAVVTLSSCQISFALA